MSQVGADVVIDDGLGNTITLLSVNISDLDAVDFVFYCLDVSLALLSPLVREKSLKDTM